MSLFSLKKLLLLAAMFIALISVCMPSFANTTQEKLAALEASSGGRLGIAAINTANDMNIQYRANERFPFCSTFKVMAVSAVLKQSMTNPNLLQQKVLYKKSDVIAWSPITEKHVTDGLTVSELSAAAIMYSDNTAIDLLMKKLGGPAAVTAFARSIGDNTFRLDRWEPELNTAIPGDVRDTTTPAAMTTSLQQLTLGDALATQQREHLVTWLKHNTTGNARIRAGVPKGWIVADKTGTGDYGTANDIGIIWPPGCSPIVVTIYFTHNKKNTIASDNVIASATHILMQAFAQNDACIKRNSK